VSAGQTLAGIAARYGSSVAAIAAANGIANPNRIVAGQVLTVPTGRGAAVRCPVSGASFMNDWGFPRSSGRYHEGTDLMARRGTPVRAPVSGRVEHVLGDMGGKQFRLWGDDGTTYIGAHMDSFGRAGRVSAGDVLGTVGDTGNARGGPTHLHFEIRPRNGPSVNPYPSLRNAC
jgi:murein DD-endopeptidase MepM/ murein hydrolase activator NlpD